jgi:hypothetical protein
VDGRRDPLKFDGRVEDLLREAASFSHVRSPERALAASYDAASGHFLITESSSGEGAGNVYELTREGKQMRKLEIPGARAEGLALDGLGRAFIADDAGGVLRVDP